ncbi:formate/nitrite transporter family protein, partial [Vibrio parahaemolyticus V-223/04]
WG